MTPMPGPLLVAEAPGVRPLHHWGRVHLEAARATLGDLLANWSADWNVKGAGPQAPGESVVSVAPVGDWPEDDLVAQQWQLWSGEESGNVWWRALRDAGAQHPTQPVLQRAVLDAMYGGGGRETALGGTLAQQMAQEAWLDWCRRLAACFGVGAAESSAASGELTLPDFLMRPWSGALALQILCAGMRILVVSDARASQQLWEGRGVATPSLLRNDTSALVPVAEALAPCVAWLSVELAPIDIGLGVLSSLRTGDVLRTTHRLDAPLHVRAHPDPDRHEGLPLCEAFLGRQGDQRGVELMGSLSGNGPG